MNVFLFRIRVSPTGATVLAARQPPDKHIGDCVGTNPTGATTVRLVSPDKVGVTVVWGNNAYPPAEKQLT